MRVVMQNAEVRGHEVKTNKNGEPYIVVRVEDETGKSEELCDKEMSRAEYYKRGTIGDLHLDIQVGKFTTIRIIDFKIAK